MKKSELRNIIRSVIKEQLDVEKNKSIKPEPSLKTGTPNAHNYVKLSACDCDQPNTFFCQAVMDYGTINIPGIDIQCNGVMCDMNIHGGDIFILDTGGAWPTVTGELIGVYNPIYSTNAHSMVGPQPASACPIEGCTDPSYFNYDPNATIDDGSCSNCTLRPQQLYNYIKNTYPNQFMGQTQEVVIAHFCERCNKPTHQPGPSPAFPFDENCICCGGASENLG